ncbi:MAG TPA: ABC transporter ATP-binding protein [Lachnospiraceae bacterium]|nr:ABC transporter ATP-binding protein [Lachnospiraceae bacterium]
MSEYIRERRNNMKALEVKNITKSFGKTKIIKDVSFHVDEGEIVAFVGPNGTGKTTTLKMITNLIWPDSGSISIMGHNLFKEREKALSNMAGIIENPGLYPNLSGKDNLKFIQKVRDVSEDRYQEVIELIGLNDKDKLDRKVRRYSLGMKQRLALGMCLLTRPKFLILDEPTNGLDPTGTIELREIIEKMAKEENVSILFSSHLLGEVEKLADRIIYIKEGRIINEKRKEVRKGVDYLLSISDNDTAMKVLKDITNIYQLNKTQDGRVHVEIEPGTLGDILSIFQGNGISVIDVEKQKENLEDIYNQIFREA